MPCTARSTANEARRASRGARGGLEAQRHLVEEALGDLVASPPDPADGRSREPAVGDVRRPAGQRALVRGLHVAVRPDARAHPPVQVPAHRERLAGRLGVHVHEDDRRLSAELGGELVGLPEGAVDRQHEDAPHEVHDRDLVGPALDGDVAHPGRARGEVRGTQEQVLFHDVLDDLLLVPDVVARGHHVGAGGEDLARDRRPHPATARGVVAVDNASEERVMLTELREQIRDRGTARLSVDVPDHQDVHRAYFATSTARVSRMTTTLMCPGYCISASMRLVMSLASWWASRSETMSAFVITRSSRPAWIA